MKNLKRIQLLHPVFADKRNSSLFVIDLKFITRIRSNLCYIARTKKKFIVRLMKIQFKDISSHTLVKKIEMRFLWWKYQGILI